MAILLRALGMTEVDRREGLRANDALKSLARSLALSEGFALHLLVCESIADVPVALDVLRDALEARGRPVEWLHLDPYPTPETKVTEEGLESNVLLRLAAERAMPPDEREVVVLHAEGIPAAQRGLWAGFFNRMNRARNLIVRRLGVPLILVVAPETESLFAEAAPDFWSGRSGSHHVPRNAEPGMAEMESAFAAFQAQLRTLGRSVCLIEGNGSGMPGTGFLVGPRLVLTAYEVLHNVIERPELASGVRIHLSEPLAGVATEFEYRLSPEWLVDAAPPSAADILDEMGDHLPLEDELGYALVRIEPQGDRKEGSLGHVDHSSLPIFWGETAVLQPGRSLGIVFRLRGGGTALMTSTIRAINRNSTRIEYNGGPPLDGRGGPCFDEQWNLVALHLGVCRGVPLTAIRKLLQARGKLDLIERHARVAPFLSPFE